MTLCPRETGRERALKTERGDGRENKTYANKVITRLHKKYIKLVLRGKPSQVAVTAVARELARFIWGVMTMAA